MRPPEQRAPDVADQMDGAFPTTVIVAFQEEPQGRGIRTEQLLGRRLRPVRLRAIAEHAAVDVVVQPTPSDRPQRPIDHLAKSVVPRPSAARRIFERRRMHTLRRRSETAVRGVELIEQVGSEPTVDRPVGRGRRHGCFPCRSAAPGNRVALCGEGVGNLRQQAAHPFGRDVRLAAQQVAVRCQEGGGGPAAQAVAVGDVGTCVGIDVDRDEPIRNVRGNGGIPVRGRRHRGGGAAPGRPERQQHRDAGTAGIRERGRAPGAPPDGRRGWNVRHEARHGESLGEAGPRAGGPTPR